MSEEKHEVIRKLLIVVESDELNRNTIDELLRQPGFGILGAETAEDGYKMYEATTELYGCSRVVLTGYKLNGESGLYLGQQIADKEKPMYGQRITPVILMMDREPTAEMAENYPDAVDDFLMKPLDLTRLEQTVHEHFTIAKQYETR